MLAREGGGISHHARDESVPAPLSMEELDVEANGITDMNVIDMIIAMVLERTDLFSSPDQEARYQAHAKTHAW